jgi:membrane fusion protein, multidrug efflux system
MKTKALPTPWMLNRTVQLGTGLTALLALGLGLGSMQTSRAEPTRTPLSSAKPLVAMADSQRMAPVEARVAALAMPAAPGAGSDDNVRVLLIPALDTTVSSPVVGRIKAIESALGAGFAAGQVLVRFDCEEPVARRDMAIAELAGAVETHEAKVRMRGLDQASDVEVALAASAAAKARAQVALGEAQVGQCNVRAPWAGRIAKVHARNAMSVNAGQPLLDLVKTGPLKLKLSVPSRWLQRMKPGVAFSVAIDETGKAYQARVTAMNSRIDAVSQSIEIEAAMASSYPDLLAGMSGTARFASVANAPTSALSPIHSNTTRTASK